MFKRPPFLSLVIALFAVALAAGPALATDEVPAPPTPPASPAPFSQAAPCVDSIKPSALITTRAAGAKHTRVVRGSGKVGHVAVSVSRAASVTQSRAKRCRFMSSKGRLGRAKSCSKPTWLSAHGTGSWAFGLPKSLGHGTYVIRAQAVDSAGNVSSPRSLRVRI
jgi:Bacterial Ig-like domain